MASQDGRTSIFIDSHAHLADAAFTGDRDAVIDRARDVGAMAIVCIGESLSAAALAAEYAATDPGFVFATAGIHPHDAASFDNARDMPQLRKLIRDSAVAVGECGLDYHYDNSPREAQERGFRTHIAAARETGLPLVIHSRDADDDMARILEEETGKGAFPAVLHCFTGGRELAHRAVALGHFISFTGILTFKNSTGLRDIAAALPADRILVETDAPYLAPGKHRGKRNEPAFVIDTANVLAEARGVSFDVIARQTTENFFRLFAKVPRPAQAAA